MRPAGAAANSPAVNPANPLDNETAHGHGWTEPVITQIKMEVQVQENDEVQSVETLPDVQRSKRVLSQSHGGAPAPAPERRASGNARGDAGSDDQPAKLGQHKAAHAATATCREAGHTRAENARRGNYI